MKNNIFKYLYLMWFGGSAYVTIEVFFRSRSHWSMFALAAISFVFVGLLNEKTEISIVHQVAIGTIVLTLFEFITGCIVNIYFGLNIWDYSNLPFNILGQICPQFCLLWGIVVFVSIFLDDAIRSMFFKEERHKYKLF